MKLNIAVGKNQYGWEAADARNPHVVKPQYVKDFCI